jgi:hypothetical protein
MLSPVARRRVLLPEPIPVDVPVSSGAAPVVRPLTVKEQRAAEWALWSAQQALKRLDEKIAALGTVRARAANEVMELAIRVRLGEIREGGRE